MTCLAFLLERFTRGGGRAEGQTFAPQSRFPSVFRPRPILLFSRSSMPRMGIGSPGRLALSLAACFSSLGHGALMAAPAPRAGADDPGSPGPGTPSSAGDPAAVWQLSDSEPEVAAPPPPGPLLPKRGRGRPRGLFGPPAHRRALREELARRAAEEAQALAQAPEAGRAPAGEAAAPPDDHVVVAAEDISETKRWEREPERERDPERERERARGQEREDLKFKV